MSKSATIASPVAVPRPAEVKVGAAESVIADQMKLLAAAEECLRREAGEEFVANSLRVYHALQWSHARIEVERGRMRSVIEWKRRAGTRTARAAAKSKLAAAKQTFTERGLAIEKQLADLQRQLHALEGEVGAAQRTVDEHDQAVKLLRSEPMLPSHVKQQFDAALHAKRCNIGYANAGVVQSRIVEIETAMTLSLPADHDLIVQRCQRLPPSHPAYPKRVTSGKPGETQWLTYEISADAWRQHVDELKTELPTLRGRLAQLEADYQASLTECNGILDFYLMD